MSVSQITLDGATVNLVATPATPGLSDIEFAAFDGVGVTRSPFTGKTQVQQWPGGDMWTGVAHLPPLAQADADVWIAFLEELRGEANAFQMGDPAWTPRGSGAGTPVVDGSLNNGNPAGSPFLGTTGWTANAQGVLAIGDYIQVGYRLYRVLDVANADSSGNAVLSIWPVLREQPANGAAIITGIAQGWVNAAGALTMTYSRPLGNWYWGALWSAFRTPTLPSDAVIQGIYPVIVASAVYDRANSYYKYGSDLSLTNPVIGTEFSLPSDPANTSFSSTEFYGASIGATLSALSGQEIMVLLNQSLFESGMADAVNITAVGFAIYYTSATPVTDPLIPPPFAVPSGQGLAWSLPLATEVTPAQGGGTAVATPASNGSTPPIGIWRLADNKRDYATDVDRDTPLMFPFKEYR